MLEFVDTHEEAAAVLVEDAESGELNLNQDVVAQNVTIHNDTTANEPYTINGNGNTVTMVTSAYNTPTSWADGGFVPDDALVFSSEDGAKVTVNDLTITGDMWAVCAGNYEKSNQGRFHTEFNNVDIVNAEVFSFGGIIAPALIAYGTLDMNDSTVYGTNRSELDPAELPVYDMGVVNNSVLNAKNSKIGTIYAWEHSQINLENTQVDKIAIKVGYPRTGLLNVGAGATVDTLDLSGVDKRYAAATVEHITVAESGKINKIVANGTEYASLDDWKNAP